jgi:plasmid stabilization system protein ParE
LEAVREAFAQIRNNPALGMKLHLPEREHWDLRFYRVRSFRNYLINFRVIEHKLYVLRVLHGSQDWEGAIRETLAPKSP